MSVMIKDCETMRAGSVHVVMRHAIVEVQCVNVVIGIHIVMLVVLLVVVRVVPINFPCCDAVVHLTTSLVAFQQPNPPPFNSTDRKGENKTCNYCWVCFFLSRTHTNFRCATVPGRSMLEASMHLTLL